MFKIFFMGYDNEGKAIHVFDKVMGNLTLEGRQRVLTYLNRKYKDGDG